MPVMYQCANTVIRSRKGIRLLGLLATIYSFVRSFMQSQENKAYLSDAGIEGSMKQDIWAGCVN
jgi:hypothetical protein